MNSEDNSKEINTEHINDMEFPDYDIEKAYTYIWQNGIYTKDNERIDRDEYIRKKFKENLYLKLEPVFGEIFSRDICEIASAVLRDKNKIKVDIKVDGKKIFGAGSDDQTNKEAEVKTESLFKQYNLIDMKEKGENKFFDRDLVWKKANTFKWEKGNTSQIEDEQTLSPGEVHATEGDITIQKYPLQNEYYVLYEKKIIKCKVVGGTLNLTYGHNMNSSNVDHILLLERLDIDKNSLASYNDRYIKLKKSDLFSSPFELITSLGYSFGTSSMSENTFDEYQSIAVSTKFYGKGRPINFPALKMNGEAGEVAEKVGKVERDKDNVYSDEDKVELMKELGDVLWYVTALATDLGYNLKDVANMNVEKILYRRAHNKVSGSGDNR